MIEILTLLHGLLVGPIDLQLRVAPEVVRIEVALDGQALAEHAGPPWKVQVPFPELPAPGRLTIAGFDAGGSVVARHERLVNLDLEGCTPPAGWSVDQVSPILLDVAPGAPMPTPESLSGQLFLDSGGDAPTPRVVALGQGPAEVLVVQDPAIQGLFDRITLAYLEHQGVADASDREHEQIAEVVRYLEAGKDPGGAGPLSSGTEAGTENRAADGSLLSRSTAEGMREPRRRVREKTTGHRAVRGWAERASFDIPGNLRYIWPAGPPVARLERETVVFPLVGPFDPGLDGVLWHLQTAAGIEQSQRMADAVAVAAYQAASTCRRRAVLLFDTYETTDGSLLTPAAVRHYLHRAQVPFFPLRNRPHDPTRESDVARAEKLLDGQDATSFDGDPWGDATFLLGRDRTVRMPHTAAILDTYQRRVEESLERQWVAWVEGRYLPGELRLDAPGWSLAGRSPADATTGPETTRQGRGR